MKCDYISFAQKIIEGRCSTNNGKDIYHSTSFIYKTTNEDMQQYQKYLKNRNRSLTVIFRQNKFLIKPWRGLLILIFLILVFFHIITLP